MSDFEQVNEGSTSYITVAFTDRDGEAATPNSITWTCYDRASGKVLQASEAVTPASSVVITVPSSVNVLANPDNAREIHRVKVTAVYGTDDEGVTAYDFEVVRVD